MAYQGWKNWETWNVALWCGNDEGIYRAVLRQRKSQKRKFTAKSAKEFILNQMPDGTPDMQKLSRAELHDAYAKVSWTEIANDLNDLSGE